MHRNTLDTITTLPKRRQARMARRHIKAAWRRHARASVAKLNPSMRAAVLTVAATQKFRDALPEFAKAWDMQAAFLIAFEPVPAARG